MGNCFCKKQKPEVINPYMYWPDVRSKEFQDMVRDLQERGQRPIVTRRGLSFIVDYNKGDSSRLPPRQDEREQREMYDLIVGYEHFPEFICVMLDYINGVDNTAAAADAANDDDDDDDDDVDDSDEDDEDDEEEEWERRRRLIYLNIEDEMTVPAPG